jgi:hypothetical protein
MHHAQLTSIKSKGWTFFHHAWEQFFCCPESLEERPGAKKLFTRWRD